MIITTIRRFRFNKFVCNMAKNNNRNTTTFERKIFDIKLNLDEDKKWATSKDASAIIKVGLEPNNVINCSNIHDYIKFRGYGDILTSSSTLTLTSTTPAHRFMTALLTFPLTLAYVLNNININNANINVLVIGARSESSLPFLWWKVFFIDDLSLTIIIIIILYRNFYT